jgi:hypothetical protein
MSLHPPPYSNARTRFAAGACPGSSTCAPWYLLGGSTGYWAGPGGRSAQHSMAQHSAALRTGQHSTRHNDVGEKGNPSSTLHISSNDQLSTTAEACPRGEQAPIRPPWVLHHSKCLLLSMGVASSTSCWCSKPAPANTTRLPAGTARHELEQHGTQQRCKMAQEGHHLRRTWHKPAAYMASPDSVESLQVVDYRK